MQAISGLTIEITLASPGVFRVIERSSGASSAIHKVSFDESALDALIAETHRSLFAINTNNDLPANSFRRLGAQIAALVLPPEINGKVEQATDSVGFYLDDYSLKIPVEILPCQDSVLANTVPVIRHWLYDASHAISGKAASVNEKTAKNALLVADPAGDLPSAATEGQSVMRFLKEKKTSWRCRYLGHSVTADALTHELPDTELLHIAAHYHDGSGKEGHGISMSDGTWLPDRIPHTPEIVFLNCCRAGQVNNENGNQSLIGKFLQQGTQHVIAPFLPTSDVIAKRFADEFYRVFDAPDAVTESVFKARQAQGAIGLLYLHYGTQSATETLFARRATSRFRELAFAIVLALGCALLAATGTVEYQKHRSSKELEQQIAEVRLQATQEMERRLVEVRQQTTQRVEQKFEEARILAEKEEKKRLEKMRLQELSDILEMESGYLLLKPNIVYNIMGEAAGKGDIPAMEVILSHKWPADGFDDQGRTPFGHAVAAGQIDALEWLKAHGADIRKFDKNGGVPLHFAAYTRTVSVMEWLYDNGADVNSLDPKGNTAMMYAAHKGFVDVMQWLFDRGAEVDVENTVGQTPLFLAEEQKHAEAVQWLKKILVKENENGI